MRPLPVLAALLTLLAAVTPPPLNLFLAVLSALAIAKMASQGEDRDLLLSIDPTDARILAAIYDGRASTRSVAVSVGISWSGAKYRLSRLRDLGLVDRGPDGWFLTPRGARIARAELKRTPPHEKASAPSQLFVRP